MIPVAQIKKELDYSLDLADIIEVLKMIASAEFSILSSRMEKKDIIRDQVISCFSVLTSIAKKSPFFIERKSIPSAFLMICSDEGFLGEVNTAVVDMALSRGLKQGSKFITIGERGARYLTDSGVESIQFPSITNEIKTEEVKRVSNLIMDLYKKKEIGGLNVVYMKFLSFTSHKIEVLKLLPCNELVSFIKGEESDALRTLVEPSLFPVVEYLVKLWLENNIYNVFWSSKLSEWSVRVMHLEHSSDELKDMNKALKFKYFKSVHALNDKVIREIFATRMFSK